MTQPKKSSRKLSLRKSAEEKLHKTPPRDTLLKSEDVPNIVHELEVHQAELEIQNEELLNTQRELTDSHDSYEVLYDFSPVGYLTLDSEGHILKANLTTEKMTGIAKSKLSQYYKFSSIVSSQSQDIWHKYRLEVAECKGKKVACELDIVKADKSLLCVNLETICILTPDKKELRLMAMMDITERKRAEVELHLRAAELEAVFNSQSDVVIEYDTERNVKRANPSFRAIYGFDPVGLNVKDIIKKVSCRSLDGRPLILEEQPTPRALQGESVSGQTFIVTRADGTESIVETSASPMSSGNHIVGSVTVWHDITSLKRAEETLQESESKYRIVAENTYDWEFWIDPVGRFIYCSPSCERITGHTVEEFLADSSLRNRLIHPDHRQQFEEHLLNKEKQHLSGEAEWRIINSNGESRWIAHACQPVFDHNGVYLGFRGSNRDITERKRSEEALREREEQLKLIVESSPDIIFYQDCDLRYTWVTNQNVHTASKRIIGKTDAEIPDFVDGEKLMEMKRNVLKTGKTVSAEFRLRVKDEEHWFEDLYSPRKDEKGNIIGIFGYARDITERKKAQQEIERLLYSVQEERDRLSSLVNSIMDEVWFADTSGKFTLANPSAVKEFRLYSEDEVDVEKFAESLEVYRGDGSKRPVEEAPPLRALKGEVIRTEEEIIRTPGTGELRYRQVNSAPVRDATGGIIGSVSVVRDITANKLAEQALQEAYENLDIQSEELQAVNEELQSQSEELKAQTLELQAQYEENRLLILHAPTAIYEIDYRTGRFISVNNALCLMSGYTRKELLAMKVIDLLDGESKAVFAKRMKDVSEGKTISNRIEFTIKRKNGEQRIFDIKVTFKLMNEKVEGAIVIAYDVTERRKMEDALRVSEERFFKAFKNSPNAITITRLSDGKIIEGNDFVFALLGYDCNDVVGKTTFELGIWADTAERQKLTQALGTKGYVKNQELTLKKKDGTEVIVDLSASLIMIDNQQCFLSSFIDITKRKYTEEALRESEKRYKNLVKYAPAAIYEMDLHGTKFLSVNDVMCDILKYSKEELLSTTPTDLLDEESKLLFKERISRKLAGEKLDEPAEYRIRCKDGEWIYTAINVGAITFSDEEGTRVVVIGHDITERKKAEDALQKINKELEQFAYVTSHDLQEPLRSMTSFTQLLSTRYSDQFDDKAKEYFGFIVDASTRMERLINDLLEFSRVGRMNTEKSLINCNNIVDRIIVNIKQSNKESGAEITRDNLPSLNANETTLTQLFQNLIANAVKFHKEGEPSRVHISANEIDEEWLFSVKDNGIGINKKYFEKIFVIFQRLHGRYEYPGTGIGLAICKKIVELYGGKIWVESTEGEGAAFYFTFPV
jgi:PAS domain S-box-containing protein